MRFRIACATAPAAVLLLALAVPARADGPPPKDLQHLLAETPLGKGLEKIHVRPYGWIDAALDATPSTQASLRDGRVFDQRAQGFTFHQGYFALERALKDPPCFDFGGKVALLWGHDARFTHARGLLDDQGDEELQFDLLEVNGVVRVPLAQGLRIKVGKWTTPMGFEVIEATGNLLPSRSYLFNYAVPFTHTGALATLDATKSWSISYGLMLGWDVWDDNNDSLTHHLGVTWTAPSGKDTVILQGMLGPEQTDDDDHLRTLVDGTWKHTWRDDFETALNVDYGTEEGAALDGGDASWGGVAAYATGHHSECLSGTLRVEWFRDGDGARLGQPASLGEITLGLDWTPIGSFRNLHVRPEVRWDHSFLGSFFDQGTSKDQLSLTLDVLITF